MQKDVGRITFLSDDALWQISSPKSLSYLGNQVLYVGSHVGDAQIVNVYGSPQTAVDEDTLPIPAGIPTHSARDINDDEDVDMDEEPIDKRSPP